MQLIGFHHFEFYDIIQKPWYNIKCCWKIKGSEKILRAMPYSLSHYVLLHAGQLEISMLTMRAENRRFELWKLKSLFECMECVVLKVSFVEGRSWGINYCANILWVFPLDIFPAFAHARRMLYYFTNWWPSVAAITRNVSVLKTNFSPRNLTTII